MLEADRLAHAQPRAVEQLDERPVAQVAGSRPGGGFDEPFGLAGRKRPRKLARAARQPDVRGRIVLPEPDQHLMPEERPDRGERRAIVGRCQTLGAELRRRTARGPRSRHVDGERPSQPPSAVRSRRYASTVRGASRAAETARNASTSGSRVRSVIHLAEPSSVHVAVRLRRRERAVAEQLLDHAQVCASLEQVRRERVAQPVRVGEEPPDRARVQAAAARREEERVLGAVGELRSRLVEVEPQPVRRLLAERDDSLLVALAPDVDRFLLEIDVRRGRGRPPRGCAAPRSRRARAAPGSEAPAARRPSPARARRRPPRTSARREAGARAEGRAGRRGRVPRRACSAAGRAPLRACARSSRERACRADGPGRAAPSSADVGAQCRGVDVFERHARAFGARTPNSSTSTR